MTIDYKKWLIDVKGAYEQAIVDYNNGGLNINEKEELYKIAPLMVAQRNEIYDQEIINEMCELTSVAVNHDFSVDPESRQHYKFHFVIAYIQSHAHAGIITEMEGDQIMEYVNEQMELFKNA